MQPAKISIVYDSGKGHTGQIAVILRENTQSELSDVRLMNVREALENLRELHQSDTIVFGSLTECANIPASFKKFIESTAKFWYNQPWKDKLGAGFTASSTRNGDKLQTLISLSLFAAQHSMNWISQGIMPRYCNDEQTDGQNRFGSYLGLMVQSDTAAELNFPHPGDRLTAELFAKRILNVTLKDKTIKTYNYESN